VIALIGFYFKRRENFLEKIKFEKNFIKNLIFIVLSSIFLIFVANSYFEGQWNEPRYTTPDSGGHYLYMSPTVDSGMMPLFMSNAIYEAAGQNETFLHHHDTYFPGGSAIFFIVNKIFYNVDRMILFQSFNVLFFILVSLYLFFILRERKIFKSIYFWMIVLFFVFFGNLFSLIETSYTNQLFGLFFLLLAIDLFEKFRESEKWGMLPIAIGGAVISYYYWFPVLILFVLFSFVDFKKIFITKLSFKENKQIYKLILIFVIAFILDIGYISNVLKTNQTGMISAGSFSLSSNFIKDTWIIVPFVLFNLYLFLRDRIIKKENYFFANFSFAVIGYSCVLLVLYYLRISASYSLEKSFFLSIPIMWIIWLEFFEKIINKLDSEKIKIFFDKLKIKLINFKNNIIQIVNIIFVFVIALTIIKESSLNFLPEKIDFFPTLLENLDDIFKNRGKDINVYKNQLDFVEKIKSDYSYVIKDGRILMISGIDDSLWIFAATGIWPRSISVMPVGVKNVGIYSPMSFYSRGIADYRQWLFNDKEHYIVIFNRGNSERWIKNSGFNVNDYDILLSDDFGNKLMKLKDGASARFVYNKDFDLRHNYEDKDWKENKTKVERVLVPVNGEIETKFSNLSGLLFNIDIPEKQKKNLNSNYLFQLKSGYCRENGNVIVEKIISANNLRKITAGKELKITFDNPIPNSTEKTFCFEFSRIKKLSDDENELFGIILKNNIANEKEIYNYINSQ
jgi:hypothetical protein